MIRIVEPSWDWSDFAFVTFGELTNHIEKCGRTCYKSEDRIDRDSADKFVRKLCRMGHESVLEHASLTAFITCSRVASHQLVRHRIGCAYSMESQRYVNYDKKGFQVICPPTIDIPPGEYSLLLESHSDSIFDKYPWMDNRQLRWLTTIEMCYQEYLDELKDCRPEDARFILPNATKTELAVTFNLRTWRHIIKERALNPKAQWEIQQIFTEIHEDLKLKLPAVFEDLTAYENPTKSKEIG